MGGSVDVAESESSSSSMGHLSVSSKSFIEFERKCEGLEGGSEYRTPGFGTKTSRPCIDNIGGDKVVFVYVVSSVAFPSVLGLAFLWMAGGFGGARVGGGGIVGVITG